MTAVVAMRGHDRMKKWLTKHDRIVHAAASLWVDFGHDEQVQVGSPVRGIAPEGPPTPSSSPPRRCLCSPSIQDEIVRGVFHLLSPGAPFIQFTYGPYSPVGRERLGVSGKVATWVPANLPPASVWVYRRATGSSQVR